jgi:hypothetical protein
MPEDLSESVNLPWHRLPSAPEAPMQGGAMSLLHRRGVRLPVAVQTPPDYGFYIARFPVQEPPLLPPGLPVAAADDAVVIPRAPHPDPVLDAAVLTMLLPDSLVPPDPVFEPAGPARRLHLPWRQDPLTGLLLPDDTLHQLWWARSFPIRCNLTPGMLGLRFDVADLDAVAWAVLRCCPLSALVEVLAGLAFQVDILGSPGLLDRAIAELLNLPGELQARLRGAVHHGSPLLDPRCLRWIIREPAAANATGHNAGPEPWKPVGLAQEAIARVLFPITLGTGGARLRFEEVLRAVWLLHDGFELGDDTAAEADRTMSLVAAYTYGVHQATGMLRFLDRGRRLLEVDDTHPAVAGFAPPPSALREAFTRETGLTTSQWVHGAAILAVRYVNWVATNRPHQVTLEQLMELELPVRLSAGFRSVVERELITTIDELGHAVLDEMGRSSVAYVGLGSTPKHDSRAMRDRPLLRSDNGDLHPTGLGLLLDRIMDLPRYVVHRSGTLGTDRVVRNIVGHMFEGYVTDRIAETRGRHQVLTEHDITAVLGQAKRGDAIIGYGGDYLLVEVSVQSLGRGIAAGDPVSITSRCQTYHEKAEQAEAMARRLEELVRAYDLPSVRSWTYLVVTDQALPNNPALANALRRIHPGRNPRFICGIDEFELLLAAGVPGWSIPTLVRAWQTGGLEQTLALRLQDVVLSLTPLDDHDTAPLPTTGSPTYPPTTSKSPNRTADRWPSP